MDVSLKHPFSMHVSGGTNTLSLEGQTPKHIVWCYAKHQQDLFKELMKINVEYVEGIPGE